MAGSKEPPEWGRIIKAKRMFHGYSIRHAAGLCGIAGTYWGQVERGRTKRDPHSRAVKPSRSVLLSMADALRMTPTETARLLASAGERAPIASGPARVGEVEIDLTRLRRADVVLLRTLADRLRFAEAAEDDVPLAAVARDGKREDRATVERRARERREET